MAASIVCLVHAVACWRVEKIPFRVPKAQTFQLPNHIAIFRGCDILT